MSDGPWRCSVACLIAALLLGCNDAKPCRNCKEEAGPCRTSPALTASAGDGEVTLTWQPASGLGTVTEWQYRQAVQGESWSVPHNTGPATAYVVSDLRNDVAYTFQVRAQIDVRCTSCWSCWSAAVSVVPRRIDDVMKRIEKHQYAIAESMAEVVKGMARRQELLERLGEQGIATLGVVATSTSAIARHSADIREGVEQVATNVDEAGEKIAGCLANIATRLGETPDARDGENGSGGTEGSGGEVGECNSRSKGAYPAVPNPPARCHTLLHVLRFGENSHVLGEQNDDVVNNIVEYLLKQKDGLVLTEGYATSVGGAVYNLHLSDMRAACTSRCLRDRTIRAGRKFAFREIARGEVLSASELAGTGDAGQRVKVTFCEGHSRVPDAREPRKVWPTIEQCGCP